ncbi:MAG: BMP family ABC transporter substrate-binding protein [Candidatus Neomarinimicrobiota bacterium]
MKKPVIAVLLFLVTMVLFNNTCDKESGAQQPTIRVATLAAGTTFDDGAFLQCCKTGIERTITDFEIECEYNIDTTTDDYLTRLEYFGDREFDLIISIGYMWNEAVVAAAPNYPKTCFVLVDDELSESQSNAVSILFDVDEASYPLGFLSAWWADNHDTVNPAVGFVGALSIPQIRQFIEPYLNGVDRYNQKYGRTVTHFGNYAGTFFDPAPGIQIADSIINLGADVIFGVGSETGNRALYQAKERGKWGIGVDVDQYISLPDVSDILISSAMKRLDNAIYAVVKSFVENNFPGGAVYTGNLANDGVDLAPFHDFDTQIPDSIKAQVEEIKAGIIDGSISTGW